MILPDRNVAEAGGEESSPEDLHTPGHHYRGHYGVLQRQSGISQLPNTGEEAPGELKLSQLTLVILQVIFKCCKLIPVLVGGILIQGKKYGLMDFTAAGN